jgi:site-specific DNA-methyltransferase (adenine-specific)
MPTELFPRDQIKLSPRIRYAETDLQKESIDNLAASIARLGLLQPILIGPDNTLIDGWRRYTACGKIGLSHVPVHRRETLTEAEYQEIELEANFQRLDFTWQETVEAVCRIHDARRRAIILEGKPASTWTRQMTGELLGGYSDSYVDNCFSLRQPLLDKDPEVLSADTITDAIRVILRRREDQAVAEKARRTGMVATSLPAFDTLLTSNRVTVNPLGDDPTQWKKCVACEGTGKNSKGGLCHICLDKTLEEQIAHKAWFEQTLAEMRAKTPTTPEADLISQLKVEEIKEAEEVEQVIDLSHTLFHGDSARTILPLWPPACVDHIITDMPYGIDMDNLDQSETSLIDTLRVADTHSVEENLTLFSIMFPACYRVLKDGGFFITWCDIMNWQYMYDLAISTGFKVQRWPITWYKTSVCKCQMAHVLFTKNTEIALVCRKGAATLPTPIQTSVIVAPNDADKKSNNFAKPFSVWEFLISSVSIEGQTILDPCAGEGSGTLAALRLNRRALAIEVDETHYPYLVDNVKTYWKGTFKKVKFI